MAKSEREAGRSKRNGWITALIVAAVGFVALQCVHPTIPAAPATAEMQAPPEVLRILQKDCYSCHSNERRLSWFDQIEPAYWFVRQDVLEARSHLNFSSLGSKPAAAQKGALHEAVAMMQMGAMPLSRFTQLHPEARVTAHDLATIQAWLAPWSSPLPKAMPSAAPETATHIDLAAVAPTANGLAFDPSMESWHIISMTDRGDNAQFRLILGNSIAVRAAREGRVSPWPDGSRLAKFAWMQAEGADGLVHPGKFWQVELMVKDAQRNRTSAGWDWGRWRSSELKPYGADASVVHECTSCHLPMRGNDQVYTEPISAASDSGREALNNDAAQLPASLPYQPLDWGVVTLLIDPRRHTASALFGNPAAMTAAMAHPVGVVPYTAGSVLALVTWAQREDPHWFGARIPDKPASIEFVEVGSNANSTHYRRYAGAGLPEQSPSPDDAAARSRFIAAQTPLAMP
jgi:hypothetical protein